MLCENYLCIYEEDGKCCLDEIELTVGGVCMSCILVDIPSDTLNALKEQTLNDIESSYK